MKLLAVLLSLATLSLGRSARALSGGSLIPAGAGSLMSGGGGVGSLNPAGGGGGALPLLPAAGGGNSLPLNPASGGGGNSLPLGGTSGGGGNPLPLGGSGDNSDLSVTDLLGPGVAALIPAPAPKPYAYGAPSGPSKASSYVPQAQAQHLGADSYQQRYRKRESQTAPADTRPTPEPTGASSASTTVHIIDEHDFALLLPDRPGGASLAFSGLITGVFDAFDAYRTHLGCGERRRGVLHARQREPGLWETRRGGLYPCGGCDHVGRWGVYPGMDLIMLLLHVPLLCMDTSRTYG